MQTTTYLRIGLAICVITAALPALGQESTEINALRTVLTRVNTDLQGLTKRVLAAEKALDLVRFQQQHQSKVITAVGTVAAFWLTVQEVQALAPYWLPADGRPIQDPDSPLNGRVLPILQDRFVLGAPSGTDITANTDSTQGGITTFSGRVKLGASMVAAVPVNLRGKVERGEYPYFIVDTDTTELQSADHGHIINTDSKLTISSLPLPPYRKLIYMVRVRSDVPQQLPGPPR